MKFENYDPVTGKVIDFVSNLDFGNVIQGQHCSVPTLIRGTLDQETSITDFKLFLESKGGWSDAQYGYYINSSFVPSIESGSSYLSSHFPEVPNATSDSSGSISIGWTDKYSDYIWIDIDISQTQTGATESNFRAFFNYI